MVVTRSKHGNEADQHDGQEAHHVPISDEQNPEVQQRPGKQPMGQGDTGSSTPRPPNPNPDFYTAIEMENAQLRSQLSKANKQIEEVLAWLPPLTTDANVGKRHSGTHMSRRDNRSRPNRSVRTSTPSSTPMSHHHQETVFEEFPRADQQFSRSVRTSTPSSIPPSNAPRRARGSSRRRSGEGL